MSIQKRYCLVGATISQLLHWEYLSARAFVKWLGPNMHVRALHAQLLTASRVSVRLLVCGQLRASIAMRNSEWRVTGRFLLATRICC